MCNKEEHKFRNPLLHLENMKIFLRQRYDEQVTEKIILGFGFNNVMRFSNFIEKVNKFLMTDI